MVAEQLPFDGGIKHGLTIYWERLRLFSAVVIAAASILALPTLLLGCFEGLFSTHDHILTSISVAMGTVAAYFVGTTVASHAMLKAITQSKARLLVFDVVRLVFLLGIFEGVGHIFRLDGDRSFVSSISHWPIPDWLAFCVTWGTVILIDDLWFRERLLRKSEDEESKAQPID